MIAVTVTVLQPVNKGVRVTLAFTRSGATTTREESVATTAYALMFSILHKLAKDVGGHFKAIQ